jgi:prolipoprotein diacylglyceryltransferase
MTSSPLFWMGFLFVPITVLIPDIIFHRLITINRKRIKFKKFKFKLYFILYSVQRIFFKTFLQKLQENELYLKKKYKCFPNIILIIFLLFLVLTFMC